MKNFRCHIALLMSVAVFAVIAAAAPYNAAGQMSHEAILTEWATAKGWIVDTLTFSGIGMGFKNKEMPDCTIGIVNNRGHWFETAQPFNKTDRGNNRYSIKSLERITVAVGSPAIRTYDLVRYSKTPSQEAFEAEGWVYYCHDYLVLVHAQRDTRTRYANGTDPRGVLNDYLAFAKAKLAPGAATEKPQPGIVGKPPATVKPTEEETITVVLANGTLFDATANRTLKAGDVVPPEHIVQTGPGAVAEAILRKGSNQQKPSHAVLAPNSSCKFIRGTARPRSASVFVIFGRVFTLFTDKINSEGYQVETYNSVSGCEGTAFETAYDKKSGKTTVAVFEGAVRVECKKLSGSPVMVAAGMRATIDNDCTQTLTPLPASADTPAKAGWPITDPGTFDQAVARLCAPDEDFVRSLYHCITHREPTAQEIQEQVGRLRDGTPRQHMIAYFFASPGYENQKHDSVRFITDACQAIYARQPTEADLRAWPRTHRNTIVLDMFKHPDHLAATQTCPALWPKIPDWTPPRDGPAPQPSTKAPADASGWLTQAPAKFDSISPKANQWSAGGGFVVMSGKHRFDKRWTRGYRNEHNDPFYLNDDDRKLPPRHSREEVMRQAHIKQGRFKVRGYGYLLVYARIKGGASPIVAIYDSDTGQRFSPHYNDDTVQKMYQARNWVFKNGKWDGAWTGKWTGMGKDLDLKHLNGRISPGQIKTLNVLIEQCWLGNEFIAPAEIEYEIWFFPREGGGVQINPAP